MIYLALVLNFILNLSVFQTYKDTLYQARVFLNRGIRYENNGELVKALEEYGKAISLDSTFTPALERTNRILILYGKEDSLILFYMNKIDMYPDNPVYHYIYGRLIHDNDLKKTEFLKCIELDSLYYWGHFGLAELYYEIGNPDSAIIKFKDAISVNPAIIDAHYSLGNLYFEKENYTRAEKEFKKCIMINPVTIVNSYYKLALIYEMRDDIEKSINYYNLFMRYAPDAPEVDHIIDVVEYLKFIIDQRNRNNFFYRLKKRIGELIK